jgi:hypothetical protein
LAEASRIEGMSALDSLASKAIWDLQEGGTAVCPSWRGSLPEHVLRKSQQSQQLPYLRSTYGGAAVLNKVCSVSVSAQLSACMHRTARHVLAKAHRHIHAAPKGAWHGLGLELRLQTVGLEKSLRPSALPNVGRGGVLYNVGSKKCSAPVFHCSVGWPTGDSRGGRDLATQGSPLVDSSGAQWGPPGEAPIGPINVQGESRSQIRCWVASAMKMGGPNTVKGDGGLPLAMSLAYIDALHS